MEEETELIRQVVWIVRHGDRQDNADPTWRSKAGDKSEDTPLSDIGHQQAQDVAQSITAQIEKENLNVRHVLASPFLRTMQTALPTSTRLKLPIKKEESVWETGCRKPPPNHQDGFNLDPTHLSAFTPTCGERSANFRPRLARSAAHLRKAFPVGSGDICIFSHADPVAYLVTELVGMDPARTGPVAACSIFKIERFARRRRQKSSGSGDGDGGKEKGIKDINDNESKTNESSAGEWVDEDERVGLFKLVNNADISHLSMFGNTEPCHPIHSYHDWCRLFSMLRDEKLVEQSFRWPPKEDHLPVLRNAWKQRYLELSVGNMDLAKVGRGSGEHAQDHSKHKNRKKIKFLCPLCQITSYVPRELFVNCVLTHNINCFSCKGNYSLGSIQKYYEQYKEEKEKKKAKKKEKESKK